jgi:hypothetical protein
MPSSLNGTGVTFNDGTQLNSRSEAGGNYIQRVYTSPATWTKPADLKAVKVIVIAGGGGGGGVAGTQGTQQKLGGDGGPARSDALCVIDGSAIPGPVSVTVGGAGAAGPSSGPGGAGGTSSFGSFVSATGGGGGTFAGGGTNSSSTGAAGAAGGVATGPAVVVTSYATAGSPAPAPGPGDAPVFPGWWGENGNKARSAPIQNAQGRGASGGGSIAVGPGNPAVTPAFPGGAGAPGIVIVEEFY